MRRDRMIIENTWSSVKTKSKLTNLINNSRIEGYNAKYESNPRGIREIFYDLFEFDQIGRDESIIEIGQMDIL